MSKEWFSNWFDTPYYHTLYKNRDYSEAEVFIDNLLETLEPSRESKFLDLACGKGRHSIYLNKKGFQIDGCDLSPRSIAHANEFKNETLSFFEHDMRSNLSNKYDFIFNLFTSFGYFDRTDDNIKVLQSVYEALPQNGTFVLDFMNAQKAINDLVTNEAKVMDNITFKIGRRVENNTIIKTISFIDNGSNFQFEERVQALVLNQFKTMFTKVGMDIVNIYGNYQLDHFDELTSDRLILVGKKI
jgi:SAM-dependent methyltransferase